MPTVLDSLAAGTTLVATGNGTANAIDQAGSVSATTSGALRYYTRPAGPAYYLRWPPPVLQNPVTVYLNTSTSVNTAATGSSLTGLDNTRDYIIVLPSALRTTTVTINGGRNIILMGGHATLAGTQTDAVVLITDNSTNGAATPQSGRIVHIEGLLADASGGLSHDGIDYACPTAIVQIQNCRITGIQGQSSAVHADISQNQGGAQEVRYDHVTGTSNYQGIFCTPGDGTVTNGLKISNVDLSYWEANPANPVSYLFWNTETSDGTQNNPVSIIGTLVISNNRSSQTVLADSIWAPSNTPISEDGNGNITFASGARVTGSIIDGNANPAAIPSGGFCSTSSCGLGYVSPGYGPSKQSGQQAMFIEEGTTNVVVNPVPASVTNYSAMGGGATVTQITDTNGNCLNVVCDGTAVQQGVAESSQAHAATIGQTWTASGYVNGDGGTSILMEIVERTNSGGFLTNGVSPVITSGSSPARYSLTYTTANSSTAYIQVRVRTTGSAGATTFNIRQLQLEQKGYATSYCDGTQTGCVWSGAANASSSSRPATTVSYPTSNHISPNLGALAIWVNLPQLIPLTYVLSVGTPNTSGQDFLGIRVNSGLTGLELIAQTGTAAATTVAIGAISTNTWAQINAMWSGTAIAGSINDGSFSSGARSSPASNFNTPLEIGALTDGTSICNGYLGPFAAFKIPLRRKQFAKIYRRTAQWNRSILSI